MFRKQCSLPVITAPKAAMMVLLGLALAGCGEQQASVSVTSAVPAPTLASVATPVPQPSPPAQLAGSGDVAAAIAAAQRAASGTPGPAATPSSSRPASPPTAVPAAQQTAQANRLPADSRLEIPEIGVNAPLVPLGVDSDGVMQVPGNGTDVGWYTFGAVPGTPGNAVLSGHLNTTTENAVFFRLKDLKIGDPMSLFTNGQEMKFQVFWTKSWPDDQAPLPLILGNAPSPTLTLITCEGTFDRASKNYSGRLVVRAKPPGTL